MKPQRNALRPPSLLALTAVATLSSCAAFNRGELVLSRHVTVGQELLDLKRAKDEGAVTESEYAMLKERVIDMVYDADWDTVMDLDGAEHHHGHDDD